VERAEPDVNGLSLDQLVELERRAAEAERDTDDIDDDDEVGVSIVLPWWQRPFNIGVLVVTGAILAGMIGWMVGDSGARPAHNEVDTGFLQDMRVHHEQAVLMGFIYRSRPDIDPGLNTIARDIVVGQSLEVGRMVQMLRTLGETEANETGTSMTWMDMVAEDHHMPGMASDIELEELGTTEGRAADELFVELMTAHHLGGIEMAEYAIEHAEYDEVVKMAAGMAAGQRSEIVEMAGELD
jgi:uncharacterized protein (DUF305 family)